MPSAPLISAKSLHDYAAFSDESHSDGNHRYMVLGGILVRTDDAHILSRQISDIYGDRFPEAIQWKSQSKSKASLYLKVGSFICEQIEERRIDFGCIVFDSRKIDHDKHNESDPEKGFFKFLYQHHLKWARHYKAAAKLRVIHGNMDTKYDLNELRKVLNNGANAGIRKVRSPYSQVDFGRVKDTRCLQIADLLIGAVGFYANGKHLSHQKSHRADLAKHLADGLGLPDLSAETSWPDFGKHIWRFRMESRGA